MNQDSKRWYPQGAFLASVVGFTNVDNAGVAGLELKYDELLTGENGVVLTAVNAWGYTLEQSYETERFPTEGDGLRLTIDSCIQHYLENALSYAVQEHHVAARAVGIVMDVNTGAVLAMSTTPSYDPNEPRVIARRAVSPWVASSILFPPFLQIAVDGRIGRAAFVEQLLQPYYRRLARIEGYGGEVGHLVAEDEGIVRHLDEKLSPAFRALQRLDHIGLFVRDGKHGFHFRQVLPVFRMVEDNLGRAVDDDGVLDIGRHVFQKQDVLCGQRDASLLFTEGSVQVGDEVSEFLVLQEVERFVDDQLFGGSCDGCKSDSCVTGCWLDNSCAWFQDTFLLCVLDQMHVHGMIAAVEGMVLNGVTLGKVDVSAIAG